ncbi:MAG: TolC family protein [Bacteroidota bacterium]
MKSIFIIIALSLLMISCGVTKRDFDASYANIEVKSAYLNQDSTEAFNNVAPIIAWWSTFNDPALDTLINRARLHNLDINVAVANFYASRAILKETKLDRFPTVTANGNYSRQRLGENVFIEGFNPTFNQYNGSFDASWESGLFGRVSNRIKGAYAEVQISQADLRNVYLSIFSEVARNYITLRGLQYQLDIAYRNLEDQQSTYDLVASRYEAGTGNNLNVSRALAQLEATRATIPPLRAGIEAVKNSLSVLIGEVPGNLNNDIISKKPLPDLPATVSIGDVNDLLRRRPDVQLAESELARQIAQYNLSVAELYPNVTFNGSIGFSAIDFSSFGQNQSFTWGLAPRISWAAFNLGRVKQQIRRDDALTLAAINQYEKVMLKALEEISTALTNYSNELERRELLRKSSAASAEAARFAKDRYTSGLDSFIDYLNADLTLLQAENQLAISEIASATNLIAIYKALGGGWEIASEEEIKNKFNQIKDSHVSLP